MILADTSVWIQHFRAGDKRLTEALDAGSVCVHPFVIGEIACGNLRNRAEVLDLLGRLPMVAVATDEEALAFLERRRLMGRGIGFIDVHLLASVVLDGSTVWTNDRRLAVVAAELSVGFG